MVLGNASEMTSVLDGAALFLKRPQQPSFGTVDRRLDLFTPQVRHHCHDLT